MPRPPLLVGRRHVDLLRDLLSLTAGTRRRRPRRSPPPAPSPCWSCASSAAGVLRRAWVNVDRVSALALITAGAATVLT